MKAESRRHAPLAMRRDVPCAGTSTGGTDRRVARSLPGPVTRASRRRPCGPRSTWRVDCPSMGRPRATARGDGRAPVRTLALQRPPAFFWLHHCTASPDRHPGRPLAAAVNPNVGAWALSPAATEIEAQTVRWIAEFIGYPVDCGGLLVSGGNMANFVGFLAVARPRLHGTCARAAYGQSRRALRVYASGESHTWIQKAADIAGLGTNAIRWIPTDDLQRMDVPALYRQLAADTAAETSPASSSEMRGR